MGEISIKSRSMHPLGKGEADSSILSGSTIKTPAILGFSGYLRYALSGINRQNGARTYSWSPWKIRGQGSRGVLSHIEAFMDRATSVYIIECNGLVKIGVAVDPIKRLKTIQTGQPVRATLYSAREFDCAKVAYLVENRLHRRFARERQMGEWFAITARRANSALDAIRPLEPSGLKIRSDYAAAWKPIPDEERNAAVDSLFSRSPNTSAS